MSKNIFWSVQVLYKPRNGVTFNSRVKGTIASTKVLIDVI